MSTEIPRWHGPALDKAMEPENPTGPEGMGVCMTALDSRKQQVIDGQLEEFKPGSEFFEETKAVLLREGQPFDDDTVLGLCLRMAIGAAWTYGISVGLNLAAEPKTTSDQEKV